MHERSKKVTQEMMTDVEYVRGGFQMGSRVGVTDLQRRTEWRSQLVHARAMEVLERSDTIAVLLEPRVYESLLGYIAVLEQELEETLLEEMFLQRQHGDFESTGETLKREALEHLETRLDEFRRQSPHDA